MYYGFVYITTNLINNKKYIGKRKIRNVKSDSTYLGSGKDLKKDIELYGAENFKRDILEYCVNEDDLPRNVLRKILRDKKPYNTPKKIKKTHYIYEKLFIEYI